MRSWILVKMKNSAAGLGFQNLKRGLVLLCLLCIVASIRLQPVLGDNNHIRRLRVPSVRIGEWKFGKRTCLNVCVEFSNLYQVTVIKLREFIGCIK